MESHRSRSYVRCNGFIFRKDVMLAHVSQSLYAMLLKE